MPLISIIVPVYKVEKYLRQCIESILNQTYVDFELILVDDGSLDECPSICDEYAKKDKRVSVIHKENGGLVSAWMRGLEEVRGEYVCFIDGDDFIADDYLMMFVSKLKEDTDVISMNCIRYWDENKQNNYKINALSEGEYEIDKSFLESIINNNGSRNKLVANSRWGKLIRRELVIKYSKYCSTEVVYGEDYQLMLGVLCGSKKIIVLDEYKYYYRFNESSIVNTYKKDLWQKTLKLFDLIRTIPQLQQIDNFEMQYNTELLFYVNDCLRNEHYHTKLTKSYFDALMNSKAVKDALLNYQSNEMGRFDRYIINALRRKSLRGVKNALNLYSLYCKITGSARC